MGTNPDRPLMKALFSHFQFKRRRPFPYRRERGLLIAGLGDALVLAVAAVLGTLMSPLERRVRCRYRLVQGRQSPLPRNDPVPRRGPSLRTFRTFRKGLTSLLFDARDQ